MANKRLIDSACKACQMDATQASDEKINQWLKEIPDWQVVAINQVEQLQQKYRFDNFIEALDFAQKIGVLAEKYNHHPAILIEWGKCQVNWWTHEIHGLHENDFILAAKSDAEYNLRG